MKLWMLFGVVLVSCLMIFGVSKAFPRQVPVTIPVEQPAQDDPVNMYFVSGTEYKPGQEGQVIVEARNVLTGVSAIVDNSTCVASIWYPDKSPFIVNQSMGLSDSNGNAFINFTVPEVDGVFEYQSVCQINSRNLTASKSFHVTKPRIAAVIPK